MPERRDSRISNPAWESLVSTDIHALAPCNGAKTVLFADRRVNEVKQHVLLTVLGVKSKLTDYSLRGDREEARLAPVALFHLLDRQDQRPTEIVAFCTEKARASTFEEMAQDLEGECPVRPVLILSEDNPKAQGEFLEILAREVPSTGSISVEFTHGPRHLSLLMLMGTMQLAALRDGLALCNVYYASQNGPISDLGGVLELSNWIYAANAFKETGSALQVARMLEQGSVPLERPDQNRQKLVSELKKISRAFADGLPWELGQETRSFIAERLRPLRKIIAKNHLPHVLSSELVDKLKISLQPFAAQHGSKKTIELTECELQRQARHIDRLHEVGHFAAAFGLMREWIVSWVVWGSDRRSQWYDRNRRRNAERQLGLMTKLLDEGQADNHLTASQRKVAEFWKELRDVRNLAHHHGMGPEDAFDTKLKKLEERVWRHWTDCMRDVPAIELTLGTDTKYKRLIVSPLGHTPGVLFSAIRNGGPAETHNDVCAVITSDQAHEKATEALAQAGFEGEVQILKFKDPFAGLDEMKEMLDRTKELILASEETHINITGGTTLMGLLAEKIARQARNYQRLGSRFILIDQRSPEEQRADPYVMGQSFVLD